MGLDPLLVYIRSLPKIAFTLASFFFFLFLALFARFTIGSFSNKKKAKRKGINFASKKGKRKVIKWLGRETLIRQAIAPHHTWLLHALYADDNAICFSFYLKHALDYPSWKLTFDHSTDHCKNNIISVLLIIWFSSKAQGSEANQALSVYKVSGQTLKWYDVVNWFTIRYMFHCFQKSGF